MEEYPEAPYFIPLIWQGDSANISPHYTQRGNIYGVGGIPHSQWGGTESIVGGGGTTMFSQYRTRYNVMVNWESPLEIDLLLDPSYESVSAEITVTGDIATTNNKVIFILTNHQNDEYFCSVISYDEYDFDLSEIGETGTFEHIINTNGYNIDDITVNVFVQTLSPNYQILQASRVIISEAIIPLQVESIDFEPTMVGETATQTIQLYNYGDNELTGMMFPPSGFTAPAEFSVAPHSIQDVEIGFAPQQAMQYSDIMIVTTSQEAYPTFFIDMTGEGLSSNVINYGDVDDNDQIEAYDASLVLSYVVGIDILPEDPIPWEDWREERSDVDLNGNIEAYDASLILSYVVGIIPELPWTLRDGEVPSARLLAEYNEGYLTVSVTGSFYSTTLDFGADIDEIITLNNDILFCENNGKLAIASSKVISGELLKIKMSRPVEITGTVNTRIGQIDYTSQDVPMATTIISVYPNPFNPETTISYKLAEDSAVKIAVYNVKGQLVESLVDEKMPKGEHQIVWNAADLSGGVYFAKLKAGVQTSEHKMILLK
ncbi:MAG: T9SS type A sorting domain-containing protein [Candidatus Stygibacter frigidus]|nr:T9SS type A sorting domain-containing protein [Candidatus Stygibacter frigidus]